MVSAQQVNYWLNIGLHVLILFTFLTILFFVYISRVETKAVSDAVNSTIKEQTGKVLSEIDETAAGSVTKDDWHKIRDIAIKIQADSQGELPEIKQNHKNLKITASIVIVVLFLVLAAIFLYYGVKKGHKIHIKKILTENAIVFACIGAIEFMFFTKVAAKYVPVTPDVMASTALERIRDNTIQVICIENGKWVCT